MAERFANFVSRVLKGNRYALVAANNNESEWRKDDELRQKSSVEFREEDLPPSTDDDLGDITTPASHNYSHTTDSETSRTSTTKTQITIIHKTSTSCHNNQASDHMTEASNRSSPTCFQCSRSEHSCDINQTTFPGNKTSCHNDNSQISYPNNQIRSHDRQTSNPRIQIRSHDSQASNPSSQKLNTHELGKLDSDDDEDYEADETVECLSRQEDLGCEIKFDFKEANVRVEENKSDNVVDKSGVQLSDLIPSAISYLLVDHGIKDKIREIKTTVRGKFQPEDTGKDISDSNEFPDLSNFTYNPSDKSIKLDSLHKSRDNTVQTYFPKTS